MSSATERLLKMRNHAMRQNKAWRVGYDFAIEKLSHATPKFRHECAAQFRKAKAAEPSYDTGISQAMSGALAGIAVLEQAPSLEGVTK